MFIIDPAEAIRQFPDLRDELITFFSLSTNPNINSTTHLPQNGREADFAQWDIAQEWAMAHRD
jgi:hypothetical protein